MYNIFFFIKKTMILIKKCSGKLVIFRNRKYVRQMFEYNINIKRKTYIFGFKMLVLKLIIKYNENV